MRRRMGMGSGTQRVVAVDDGGCFRRRAACLRVVTDYVLLVRVDFRTASRGTSFSLCTRGIRLGDWSPSNRIPCLQPDRDSSQPDPPAFLSRVPTSSLC